MKSKLVVTVEFGETDPAAIVFYPNFFRWFDARAWRLLVKADLTLEVLQKDFGLIGVPIAEAKCEFKKPLRFGDSVEITSYATSWKNKTFILVHEVRKDGDLYARGQEIRVCAKLRDDGSGSIYAIPIPDEIRRRLSAKEP